MRATTIGLEAAPPTPGLDRLTTMLLFAFVASLQLSIAAADILGSALFLCWIAGMVRDKRRPAAPPFFVALLAYAGITLISSAFSVATVDSLSCSSSCLRYTTSRAVSGRRPWRT